MKAGLKATFALGLSALVLAGGTATANASTTGGDTAAKRGSCQITLDNARSTYATYIQSLKTKGTSCGKGWKVVKAFHDCRKANGGRDGRCNSRVEGYKCKEGSRDGVQGVSYRANVTCKKGSKKVVHEYQMSL